MLPDYSTIAFWGVIACILTLAWFAVSGGSAPTDPYDGDDHNPFETLEQRARNWGGE